MKKPKLLQFSFLFTAVFATVLFLCVPFDIIPVFNVFLFCSFVLAPLVVSIVFQTESLKRHIIAYKKALDDYYGNEIDKEKQDIRFPLILAGALYTIAELKSKGINPNRAGPFKTFA